MLIYKYNFFKIELSANFSLLVKIYPTKSKWSISTTKSHLSECLSVMYQSKENHVRDLTWDFVFNTYTFGGGLGVSVESVGAAGGAGVGSFSGSIGWNEKNVISRLR